MSSELNKIPIVVIGGPTAVGKTALSIEMAKALNGEMRQNLKNLRRKLS